MTQIISCMYEVLLRADHEGIFGNDSRANTAEFVHVCFVQLPSEE